MISKEHMHNGNAARRVHDGCNRLTPPHGAQMKRIMLPELRIDPSDSVLDIESLDGSLATTFRVSRFGFERESYRSVVKQFLGDLTRASSRLIFASRIAT